MRANQRAKRVNILTIRMQANWISSTGQKSENDAVEDFDEFCEQVLGHVTGAAGLTGDQVQKLRQVMDIRTCGIRTRLLRVRFQQDQKANN